MNNKWELIKDGYEREQRLVSYPSGLIVGRVCGSNYDKNSGWIAWREGKGVQENLGTYVTEGLAKKAVEADVTALHERRIADLGNQLANQATEITIRCSHCGEIICKEDEWGEKVPTHMEHCEKNPVTKLVVENAALKVRLEVAEDKLRLIADWCAAYPLEEFPKPNMKKVRALLGDTLLTQLSAYNMRHVCEGIAKIAAQAGGNDAPEESE